MSDHDSAPEPIDKAYDRAEAMLSDEAARAARRARVMAALEREPAAPAPASRPRTAWRQGGWLAAAGVAGLAFFVARQAYRPPPPAPSIAARPAAPIAVGHEIPASPTPAEAAAPKTSRPAPRTFVAPPAPPPARREAPAAGSLAETARAFPEAPAAPPSAVLAKPSAPAAASNSPDWRQNEARDEAVEGSATQAAKAAPPVAALARAERSEGSSQDLGARLRAAAAAGRTGEVDILLAEGVAVDASDARGDTALMRSVRADRPGVAALLRRHGASLDRRNHAGESARNIAATRADAALSEALGLIP
ncbi:MAG TPA: ankyrin repeat domain-containing protein [Caulobacteraceae bacterium]|jgi:hypothetical protein|nr:ankyrin repeat domain-containing protein [Caulobacteraceae bacterium]